MRVDAVAPRLSLAEKQRLLERSLQGGSNLSHEQYRLWLLRQLNPSVPTHEFMAVRLDGSLCIHRLEQSLNEVLQRHESLQSAMVDAAGSPLRILSETQTTLEIFDLTDLPADEREGESLRLARDAATRPLDLSAGHPLRTVLVRLGPDANALFVTMHQMVADRASLEMFLRDVNASYNARNASDSPSPVAQRRKFSEFVLAERQWLNSDEADRELDYWRSQLARVPVLKLPTDHPRPDACTHAGVTHRQCVPQDTLKALTGFACEADAELSDLFMSAFQVLLARYSRQWDFALSEPAERPSEWRDCVGPLTNTLAIRVKPDAQESFLKFLHRTRDARVEARLHGRTPFVRIIDELQPRRELSHNPIAQVMFDFRKFNPCLEEADLCWSPMTVDVGTASLELTLRVVMTSATTELQLEGNSDLFIGDTMGQMLRQLVVLLENVGGEQQQPISQLSLASEPNGLRVIRPASRTDHAEVRHCIHELVEQQAERTPDAPAVICRGQTLTYKSLNQRANQVAHRLRRLGVLPETPVGVLTGRSTETVVAILATLKSGGTYVPIDPSYPRERINVMLANSGAQILLTERRFLKLCAGPKVQFVDDGSLEAESGSNPEPGLLPTNLAYVIYTSGSTGTPKGVQISHQAVVNNLLWRQRCWPIDSSDRCLQHFSFSFDPSVWATFWPLITGAATVVTGNDENYAQALVRRMIEHRVTVFGAAPALHDVVIDEPNIGECSLRLVFSGGELLRSDLAARIRSRAQAQLVNMYGPTEATIDATSWICGQQDESSDAPIGKPVDNHELHLLSEHLSPISDGLPGEIYIGGFGLARGYLGRADLTAERFIPHPTSDRPGARLYRTGDLGRKRPDGSVVFLGRIDEQVKVRGYRIELGEIESKLQKQPGVKQATVVPRETVIGQTKLIAYFVAASIGHAPTRDKLKSGLGRELPKFMIPDDFVLLPELPRTPTGKIDRQALPEQPNRQEQRKLVEPRDTLEREIAQAFETILSIEQVGVEDNFFECGGDSLLAARLSSRLSSAYAIDLPMLRIFEDPTVAGMALLIRKYRNQGRDSLTTTWDSDRLEAEAALDPSIHSGTLHHADVAHPQGVLITGVTGYLGAFLLEDIMRETTATAYCLVRAQDRAQAMERIEETCRFYRIWDETWRSRIRPIHGNLAKPQFGVSTEVFAELASQVDTIYHSGALVNFVYPYSALKPANVSGTGEVLKLAHNTRLKAVHFISTIDVLLGTGQPRPFLENDDPLDHPTHLPDGYPLSKLVAEKMVANARDRGIPICIYRPGLVMGHTLTGATQPNSYLFVGLKGYIDLGVLPEDQNLFDVITVDYAARSIGFLSRQKTSLGKTFHLWNPNPIPTIDTYEWIRSFGYDLKTVSREAAREKVIRVKPSNPLYPFVPHFQRTTPRSEPPSAFSPNAMKLADAQVECSNTLAALRESGIECPAIDETFAWKSLSFLNDVGFLPPPAATAQVGAKRNTR